MMRKSLWLTACVFLAFGFAAGVFAQDMQIWCASSAEKIFRDTAPSTVSPDGLHMSAAGGEYESVQLIITPKEDIANVRVTVAASDVKVFEVRYVAVPHTSEKMWPDPLPRHLRPMDLKAGENQPFWIKVFVPEWQSPGLYWTTVHVNVDGEDVAVLPLTVRVYPFTISQTPHLRTAFGISDGYVQAKHNISKKMNGPDILYSRYYEMLLEHRISAYGVPFGLTDERALKYLRDPRVTSFVIPYTEDREEFEATRSYLADKGVFQKGFYYPIDEPFTKASYDTLQQRAGWVHEMTGTGKVCSPFFRGPDFDQEKDLFDIAEDWLDIWCINTGYLGPKQMEKMKQRKDAGDEAWWYVCCGPGKPKANFFIDMNAMQHRILFWQAYMHNVDGLLYWSTTYWNPASTKDPWEDMATVKDINPNIYGDGSLMYPGSKVGVNFPVSSVRLECILDGMEDFEYLVCLEREKGKQAADAMAGKLVTSLTEYSTDPAALAGVRDSIASELTTVRPAMKRCPGCSGCAGCAAKATDLSIVASEPELEARKPADSG